jgi:DNA-binding CsgD family transcriptional regulator
MPGTGKRLNDIAAGSGVKITTLRTQLRSILRKVGVDRQTQLVQVLSKVQAIEPD